MIGRPRGGLRYSRAGFDGHYIEENAMRGRSLQVTVLLLLVALLAAPACAQGPGFWNVAPSIPGKTQCSDLTNPVVGRTWCADGNDPSHWRVWNGTTYVCIDCAAGTGTVTGTGT